MDALHKIGGVQTCMHASNFHISDALHNHANNIWLDFWGWFLQALNLHVCFFLEPFYIGSRTPTCLQKFYKKLIRSFYGGDVMIDAARSIFPFKKEYDFLFSYISFFDKNELLVILIVERAFGTYLRKFVLVLSLHIGAILLHFPLSFFFSLSQACHLC